jgi:hypothetical protein
LVWDVTLSLPALSYDFFRKANIVLIQCAKRFHVTQSSRLLQKKDRLGVGYLGFDTVWVLCGLTPIFWRNMEMEATFLPSKCKCTMSELRRCRKCIQAMQSRIDCRRTDRRHELTEETLHEIGARSETS